MQAIAHESARTTSESLHWKLTREKKKSLAAPINRTCVSGVTVQGCTNRAAFPPAELCALPNRIRSTGEGEGGELRKKQKTNNNNLFCTLVLFLFLFLFLFFCSSYFLCQAHHCGAFIQMACVHPSLQCIHSYHSFILLCIILLYVSHNKFANIRSIYPSITHVPCALVNW